MCESREQRFQAFARSDEIPVPYQRNTTSEDETLSATTAFETLFLKFFPDRKPLLLTAFNECNQRKHISTFIRPTALLYDDLFNLESCCKYTAGYMTFEPLHDPQLYEKLHDSIEQFPVQVASPATALKWQAGNCLELSLVLVSFLRGIGYNALVVCGYAHLPVCLNDQSNRMWKSDLPEEINSDDEDRPLDAIDPDYLALMKERPRLRRVSDPDPWKEDSSDDEVVEDPSVGQEKQEPNSLEGRDMGRTGYQVKPAHCWVLVLPGGRKTQKTAVFVEPSTGELIPPSLADEFYTGIESLFNDKNYHVNLRHSSPPSTLSFDLKDTSQWESLFTGSSEAEEKDNNLGGAFAPPTRRGLAEATGVLGQAGAKSNLAIPRSWVSELSLTPTQYASRYPGHAKVLHYANATVKLYAEYSQTDMRIKEVHLPDDANLDLTQLHIFYAHRADKLRRRTLFPQLSFSQQEAGVFVDERSVSHSQTAGQVVPPETAETAAQSYRLLWEWYEIGRMRGAAVEGLRECIHEPGKQRTLRFYWRAREDGLAMRKEFFYNTHSLRKVKELYRGRVDRLSCRSATFERPKTVREGNSHNAIVNPGSTSGLKDFPRLEPIRLSQKFERAPAAANVPPEKDVAKTKFIRPQGGDGAGEMWVFFHFGEESIIRPYHMFAKGSSKVEDYIASSVAQKALEPPMKIVTVPGQPQPSDLELFNERKWLSGVEADCLAAIRVSMDEQLAILLSLERDHAVVQVTLSSYDTLRNRPSETEAERVQKLADTIRREESRKDYLAPYIAKLEMPGEFDGNYLQVRLTAEQAKQVRDEALTELKERLIQRGHIMQSRMDREKEDFNKRQLLYQKNADVAAVEGGKEAEEFARYCKEATWRMKVLDERLSKHIDHASERYALLAQRLSEDPRLAALYGN